MARKEQYANVVLALFASVLTAVLVYLFYVSPLRTRIETKLFDIRTRLSPSLVSTDRVAVVAIDNHTISTLDSALADNLSYPSLVRVIDAALHTRAAHVVVLMPAQAFSYKDPQLNDVADRARADPRLILGTFEQSVKSLPASLLPKPFQSVIGQVTKADVERDFRREFIRKLVIREANELPLLDGYLTQKVAPEIYDELVRDYSYKDADGAYTAIELNYFNARTIQVVRAEDLVHQGAALDDKLAGRTLLIGYTTYRPWTPYEKEATYINTPWSSEGSDARDGLPVVMLHAEGLVNLLERAWLRPAPLALNLLQTILIALGSLAIWRLSVGFASLSFIGGWSILLLLHAAIFSVFHTHLPLADTALWSSLATMAGALWRMRIEGRMRADQEARLLADREMAEVQDRFLNRFATELSTLNTGVMGTLTRLAPLKERQDAAHDAYLRAIGSCEELGDYLSGIQQFASLKEDQLTATRLMPVGLAEVIQTVLRQFDSRRQESRLTFQVTAEADLNAHADRTLVAQILYNLISNAVKYSPPDKTIWISVAGGKKQVTVKVKDEGPGISKEFQGRIFEKFYRVKDDYVYKLKGHGLGLYLSRYFADRIGASLTVRSEPGHGAEFALTLKRYEARP